MPQHRGASLIRAPPLGLQLVDTAFDMERELDLEILVELGSWANHATHVGPATPRVHRTRSIVTLRTLDTASVWRIQLATAPLRYFFPDVVIS